MYRDGHAQTPASGFAPVMPIAVIDSNFERRIAVAGALFGLRSSEMMPRITTLSGIEDFRSFAKQDFKVILLAADGNQGDAMKVVEAICRGGSGTVMAYSPSTEDDLLIKCMRAGVREFLTYPFATGVLEEAFSRANGRSLLVPDTKKATGKSFVFLGAKGGAGGTTAACNFAVSMAQESKKETLLIDLDLPLGDAALCLGIGGEFSTVDALSDPERLDATFLKKLVARHSSGLFVLGAPGQFVKTNIRQEAIAKLIEVASNAFEYVVIDTGSRWNLAQTRVFDMVSTIYLVTQMGVAELRNANRLITGCLQPYAQKLEIVLNRHKDQVFGIEEKAIQQALARNAEWRIPNNYRAVQEMRNTARPLAFKDSSIQRAIQLMARSASGLAAEESQKKRKFGVLGLESAS
jgi:pilus assembly protein CpaE